MTEELARVAVGLPVAVLWPRAVPAFRRRAAARVTCTTITGAYVLAPLVGQPGAWALLVVTALLALVLADGDTPAARPEETVRLPRSVVAAIALGCVAALAIDVTATWHAVRDVVEEESVAYVVVGGLAAIFVAGSVIGAALKPISDRLTDEPKGFVNAGRYIGWLERSLTFAFIVAGEPGAAALALTAKSVARFPAFAAEKEPLAEYVLLGTLLSFLAATAIAVAVRAALGLPAM